MESHAMPYRTSGGVRWRVCAAVLAVSAVAALLVAHTLTGARVSGDGHVRARVLAETEITTGEGGGGDKDRFPWSKAMLRWQRTGFHFQPDKHYMNDPNAPMYYRGWYHFFYQYNPRGETWGNISWGHAVSRDMLNWRSLPLAMVPEHWYESNGVLTGSATLLPNGKVVVLYTGNTDNLAQVQCLAEPADPNDPLLRTWTKYPGNPVLFPPPGTYKKDFRDPMTAWFDKSDNTWRTIIGSKDDHGHAGIALMYKTKDFIHFELIPHPVHRVEGTGMWECVDLYPVGDNKNSSEKTLYVLKASMDDERHDYYALGRFDAAANKWTPLDPELDVGIGLRYNWGKLFASTSFYDPVKQRRVSWGYVGETDSNHTDIAKGWANLQAIPRTVALDEMTRTNLLQWPVEEIDVLRYNTTNFNGITIRAGSVIPLHLHQAAQLDIEASFRLNASAVAALNEADVSYNCSTSGGAANRGVLGPFGLLIHATKSRSEQMAVYFYVSRGLDGGLRTHFCHDELRSSRAQEPVKRVVGSTVPVLHGEGLSARVLVDHSIVESFVMGGRLTATSRVYPTEAIYAAGGVYVFNNATGSSVTIEKLVVHDMASSTLKPYVEGRD
ncbi:sucrose:sucrose 1-fructosyltransferase-like [Hordeum vulgare subsp. vulgare]|uniref:Vacuolar invertase n=1 Tax=Hordeum vulgare subsp. vulgare TaxID=112509 RepID=J7GR98_HORVV|nr:sucrose:sucrose 1-fructosyltransferase-like [Hordeum vulgare subsp. vulgare]AFP72242.1 vacuolar invertase [Hordeum vulgare subsp. vulgare]